MRTGETKRYRFSVCAPVSDMGFVCEDLAKYGVVLSEPTREELYDLRVELELRWQARPEGCPPVDEEALSELMPGETAVLENQAAAIAGVAYYCPFARRWARGRSTSGFREDRNRRGTGKLGVLGALEYDLSRVEAIDPFRGALIGDHTDVRHRP